MLLLRNYLKTALFLLSFIIYCSVNAQEDGKTVRVRYRVLENGKALADEPSPVLLTDGTAAKIVLQKPAGKKYRPGLPEEASYIDYRKGKTYQAATLGSGRQFHVEGDLKDLTAFTPAADTATILGLLCRKAKAEVFSNKIEIWYTEALHVAGSPSMRYYIPGGLILRIVRNGNSETVADQIDTSETHGSPGPIAPSDLGEKVEPYVYRSRLNDGYVTTVRVFDHEQISFGNDIVNPDDLNGGKVFRYGGGTVILRKVALPVVTDDYQLFAEVTEYSNGDAYDRNGSVFLVPADSAKSFLDGLKDGTDALPLYFDKTGKKYQGVAASADYLPMLELVRFITPFGVRQFNEKVKIEGIRWEDSVVYRQELTPLLPVLQGEALIGAYIGNYDKGGHILSLTLKYHPNSMEVNDSVRKKPWILPLFNTLNVLEAKDQASGTMFLKDSLSVSFEVPPGLKNLRLQYITTGHGGWDGGDEFNKKQNDILADGKKVFSYTPWRTDCETFRRFNPASGNAWNGLSSSDYSRSGWCPGTSVNPVDIPLDLKPGKHLLQVAIPMGQPDGPSSSAWNVSGVLIGEY